MMTVKGGTAALLACLLVSQTARAAHGYNFKAVEAKIREAVAKKQIPSMVVAVAKDGRIVYERAFGYADLEAKVPATVDTGYRIASVSKPITATGLMVLHQKGLVDIDAPAERYMAPLSFRAYAGDPSDVTLRHLLSHTSGLNSSLQHLYPFYIRLERDKSGRDGSTHRKSSNANTMIAASIFSSFRDAADGEATTGGAAARENLFAR